jgi:hypothetical protein
MLSRLALLAALLGSIAACAPATERVTRSAHSEGGIGGTGLGPDEEGGVGGTGIFGTVTGLGSVHLNGLRVEVPEGVQVPDLALGDSVAVEAGRAGRALVARRVVPVTPLAGPIDRLDRAHRRLSVMGTPVVLDGDAALTDSTTGATLDLGDVSVGDRLEVSGIWRSGAVVASRLERTQGAVAGHVAGLLTGGDAIRSVGGTAVDLACCTDTGDGFAVVSGTYRDGRLVAERVDAAGTGALFAPTVDRLVVEAFLARDPDGAGFHLSGFGIPMDPASPVPPTVDQRSIFVGRLDGDFLIERSYGLPEGAAARRRALDRLGTAAELVD